MASGTAVFYHHVKGETTIATPKKGEKCNRPMWNPTPEEIRGACLEIQKEWTEEERLKRAGKNPAAFITVPEVRTGASVPMAENPF